MKVDNNSDYTLIFSISNHPFLGVLIEPYVVAYTPSKTLSLTYQKVFSGNSSYYSKLTSHEHELIAKLDGIMAENIVKKFSPIKKIRPKEYFHKHFQKSLHKSSIRPYIERHLTQLLSSIKPGEINLYLADDINPASQKITICEDFTKVLFHFRKNENGTSYFVTLKHKNEKVMFMKQNGLLVSNKPAYIAVNKHLYKFYDFVDGSKLGVFLNKKYIHIRPESEKHYYETYISSLLETAPVYAEGFEIITKKENAIPCLSFVQHGEHFGFKLAIEYEDYSFDYKVNKQFHVQLNWNNNNPIFTKYKCSKIWESNKIAALNALDLHLSADEVLVYKDGSLTNAIDWLRNNADLIQSSGFKLINNLDVTYSYASPKIQYNITDNIDWFDIDIDVEIGEFLIPFKKRVAEIKRGNKQITLPNNEIFIFPEEWFHLSEALENAKKSGSRFLVKKYQLDVLKLIKSKKIKDHLSSLVHIKEETPSRLLNGKLRKYQLDGLSWLMFLKNNHFGGILADDMGLGKTIQTLAFLQLAKTQKQANKPPFLLIGPTSLLFNWKQEIEKFTPNLTYKVHAGARREKDPTKFSKFDLVITTYGLIRNDFELFSEMEFD
ncbi:MAG: DEAD/DEAH box helicase, partial [Bacteroidia bacterium]|nr:DEAD/DEAH box helicase [Bacteroidia bacterium]